MLYIIIFNLHHDLMGGLTVLNLIWQDKETGSENFSDSSHMAGRGKKQTSNK